MLSRIFIKNFALIDELDISLKSGLQVITGETGAGKSIILGALRLILGERADLKSIADTDKKSVVEVEFSLENHFKPFFEYHDLDFELQTIIRREILPSGKSRAFINDVPVTLDILKKLSERLIDIHSQFETSNLFDEKYQFAMIDGHSDNKTLIFKYQEAFSAFQNLQKQLKNLQDQLSTGNSEADYQLFLLSELQEANLDSFNFEELQNQLQTQENAEYISGNLGEIISHFYNDEVGIFPMMQEVKSKFNKISGLSKEFLDLDERWNGVFLELKDIISDVERQTEKIEINPALLLELNGVFNKTNALFLKHKVKTLPDLIAIRDEISTNQKGFSDLESHIDETKKNIAEKLKILEKLAKTLAENRTKSAVIFSKNIEQLLQKLGLEKAKIQVQLIDSKTFNKFGNQEISILFQANAGFPLKPIQSAISGGERSRVMLAVKKIMAENEALPTLILDEIDTGVSGKIASEMGIVMQEMAENLQLIVITHLAQVAAKGNDHYKVLKREVANKTQTTIISLSPEQKVEEIAQLLSGSAITEAAISQAKELMK